MGVPERTDQMIDIHAADIDNNAATTENQRSVPLRIVPPSEINEFEEGNNESTHSSRPLKRKGSLQEDGMQQKISRLGPIARADLTFHGPYMVDKNGFLFTKRDTNKNNISFWRCKNNCSARASEKNGYFTFNGKLHNHFAPSLIESLKSINNRRYQNLAKELLKGKSMQAKPRGMAVRRSERKKNQPQFYGTLAGSGHGAVRIQQQSDEETTQMIDLVGSHREQLSVESQPPQSSPQPSPKSITGFGNQGRSEEEPNQEDMGIGRAGPPGILGNSRGRPGRPRGRGRALITETTIEVNQETSKRGRLAKGTSEPKPGVVEVGIEGSSSRPIHEENEDFRDESKN